MAEDIQNLAVAARDGDTDALNTLITLTCEHLGRLARGYSNLPASLRDEAVSEAIIKIFRNLPAYDPERSAYKTWAGRIGENTLRSFCRDEKRRRQSFVSLDEDLSIPGDDVSPYQSVMFKCLRVIFFKALMEIKNTDNRNALLMVILCLEHQKKAAEFLGTSRNTYKSRLDAAISELARIIESSQDYSSMLSFQTFLREQEGGITSVVAGYCKKISDRTERKVLERALEKGDLREAARAAGLSVEEFRDIFRKALVSLAAKLTEYRRIVDSLASKKECPASVSGYLLSLFRHGVIPGTRDSSYFPPHTGIYRDIADALFTLFIAPELPPTAGEIVTGIINTRGISRDTIMEELGVSGGELFGFLEDRTPLPAKAAGKLAKILGIPRARLERAVKTTYYPPDA